MRTALTFLLSLTCTVWALAQGQFEFGNAVGPRPPVYDIDGRTKLAGPDFLVQAYLGRTPDSLVPLGPVLPFRMAAAAGYWWTTTITVPDMPAGTRIYVQARAWEAAGGPTWEAARTAGRKYGQSNTIPLTLAEWAYQSPMLGLQSFSLVPEPPAGVLGTVALALLLFIRRKPWSASPGRT
jgi:hypothetical protein